METLWLQVEAIGRDSRLPPITSITTWKPVGGQKWISGWELYSRLGYSQFSCFSIHGTSNLN